MSSPQLVVQTKIICPVAESYAIAVVSAAGGLSVGESWLQFVPFHAQVSSRSVVESSSSMPIPPNIRTCLVSGSYAMDSNERAGGESDGLAWLHWPVEASQR